MVRCWRLTDVTTANLRVHRRPARICGGYCRATKRNGTAIQAHALRARICGSGDERARPSNSARAPLGGSLLAHGQTVRQRGTSSQPRRATTSNESCARGGGTWHRLRATVRATRLITQRRLALHIGRSGHPVDNAGTEPVPDWADDQQSLHAHVVDGARHASWRSSTLLRLPTSLAAYSTWHMAHP